MSRDLSRLTRSLLVLALASFTASAQPVGSSFGVNTFTTSAQYQPRVASAASGDFVVVWTSAYQDGSYAGVFGRRFGAAGDPLGGEFRVNAWTTGDQYQPAVAAAPDGRFLVAWSGEIGEAFARIVARRFSSAGAPLTTDFLVNSPSASIAYDPAVAADPSGGFVVVWMSYVDGASFDIFARRFAPSGSPLGDEFRVNSFTQGYQSRPVVAVGPTGGFVVAWEDYDRDESEFGVYAQRFSSAGELEGGDFRVNASTTFSQTHPAIAFDTAGRFMVVWQSSPLSGGDAPWQVLGRRFGGDGAPLGGEITLGTTETALQRHPVVASDGGAGFVVAWANEVSWDAGSIVARAFRGSGTAAGPEFAVNADTTGLAWRPAIAVDARGGLVLAWPYRVGGGEDDVFARRFLPAMLKGDANGNGTVDVSDVFYLINALFAGGAPPTGWGDVNADGQLDVVDVFYLVNSLFAGGPPPA